MSERGLPASWGGHNVSSQTGSSQSHRPIPVRGFASGTSASQSDTLGQSSHLEAGFSPSSAPAQDEQTVRRRSSVAERLGQFSHYGGPNSLNNFARSWQRAVGYYQLTPDRRASISTPSTTDSREPLRPDLEHMPGGSMPTQAAAGPHTSLLRAAIEAEGLRIPDETPIEEDEDMIAQDDDQGRDPAAPNLLQSRQSSTFSGEPQIPSPRGSNYGSIPKSDLGRASRLYSQQQKGKRPPDQERESLLVKQTPREDDKVVPEVLGQSTVPQTVFNSVNVLVGVGMLALPLAILYAGWLIGLGFFILSALSTSYTAKLLAKCLDTEKTLITFADIAYAAFGSRARVFVSILFTLELLASSVALVVLFGDTMDALIPGWGTVEWKLVCGVILLPLAFMPLRYLSFSSILGIGCCIFIVGTLFIDGFIKPEAPGSLRQPATTHLFPQDWRTLPLAFGLLMAPWGGHSVFPNIYRDMRHPTKYNRAVFSTYAFTTILELAMCIIGYLMFGDKVRDEVTNNIFFTEGYPHWLSICMGIAIAIIPLTKVPLTARPIISTIEIFCGLDARAMPGTSWLGGMSGLTRGIMMVTIRIVTTVVIVILAILVPDFDRVLSFLGSLACFSICIILPCSFYLKIFGKEISVKERILCWVLLSISSVLAITGTVVSFFPKEMMGAK